MISITSLGQMATDSSLLPVTTDYSRLLVTQNKLVEPTTATTALEPAPQPTTAQPIITLVPTEPAPAPAPQPVTIGPMTVAPTTFAPEPAPAPPSMEPIRPPREPAPEPLVEEAPSAGARPEVVMPDDKGVTRTCPDGSVVPIYAACPAIPPAIVGLSRRGKKIAFWMLLLLAAGFTARHIAKRRRR